MKEQIYKWEINLDFLFITAAAKVQQEENPHQFDYEASKVRLNRENIVFAGSKQKERY